MFELFKFIRNNKNGKSYAVARSNLKFRYRGNSTADTNDVTESKSDKEIAEEISYLQTTLRYNNLKVYKENIKQVKHRRFAVYTLPALFVLTTILSFVGPDNYVYGKNFDTYKKVETHFSDGMMETKDDGITYCFGEVSRTFEDADKKTLTNRGSYLDMYILKDGEGVYAPYSFSGEELLLSSKYINEGVFVVDEINAKSGEEISTMYSDMFDRALELLIDSKRVDKEYQSLLENIDTDTKINFVAKLVEYEYTGEQEVNVSTPAVYFRVVSSIVTALYVFIFAIPALRRPVIECEGLEVDGPKLKNEDHDYQHRFTELPLEYRSAFIAAETNRIKELARIADEYLTTDSKEMLFTNFEKKLILK